MITRVFSILLFLYTFAHGASIELKVVDSKNAPVEDANVKVAFANYSGVGESIVRDLTDERGEVRVHGSADHSIAVRISKPGHHPANIDQLRASEGHSLEVILPRVISPRPLVYYKITPKIPKFDEWYEFDMELGDWLTPYGIGEKPDLIIRLSRNFMKLNVLERDMAKIRDRYPHYTDDDYKRIWGIWDMALEIRFPLDQGGIVKSKQFYKYNELSLPHEAPSSSYEQELCFKNVSNRWSERHEEEGYFIKTRVLLDENNQIVSANYAKLLGESRADVEGAFILEYYFNPDPNDRNLEHNGTNLAEVRK